MEDFEGDENEMRNANTENFLEKVKEVSFLALKIHIFEKIDFERMASEMVSWTNRTMMNSVLSKVLPEVTLLVTRKARLKLTLSKNYPKIE